MKDENGTQAALAMKLKSVVRSQWTRYEIRIVAKD
jgi:hypothetical protein